LIRVIVSGICGRMGTLVARSVANGQGIELVGGVEMPDHENVGRRLCEVWAEGTLQMRVAAGLDAFAPSDFDVIADFSTPAQSVNCAELASSTGKGLVVGTTGLTTFHMALVQEAAKKSPIVVAPNTSVAMNVLFGLVKRATASLGTDFDIEIVETHHRAKLDAPSGTADRLLRIISEERDLDPSKAARHGRAGPSSKRSAGEIGVHSVRGGAVAGRHRVSFMSDFEELQLSHEALSREAFARGAVRAIEFVHGKPPGLYDMLDVLGLQER
jgi:4-hydroxy-tetrahydrodipicolinate reductase